jgi:hypothetical protein
MRLSFAVAALAVCLAAPAAQASLVIAPVGVTGPGDSNSFTDWLRTIDQSGLTVPYVSGVTDFATFATLNPRHGGNNAAIGASDTMPGNVDYDLGATYNVGQLLFWNSRFGGTGVTGIEVSTSSTPDFAAPLNVGVFTVLSDGDNSSSGMQVFDLIDSSAQYVRVRVTSIAGGFGFSFGEVAFVQAVPEPSSAMMIGAVVAAIVARRRRFA